MPGSDKPLVQSARRPRPSGRRRNKVALGTLALLASTTLTGCTSVERRGYLPKGVTSLTHEITDFWVASWVWALVVGGLTWAAMFYCVVRFRRKRTDVGLPPQMAYNVPIEILFTVVPLIMVAVFFGKTVELENKMLDTSTKPNVVQGQKKPPVVINVIGKQWSWDFNYSDSGVYEAGQQANMSAPNPETTVPTLYLPVDRKVQFILTSRDVIHDFWVIQFLMKMDMIPGKVNRFNITPTETGTYQGKCAELCGAYHSQMLFRVKVVSQAAYDKHIQQLRQRGNVGFLSNALDRDSSTLEPKDQRKLQQWIPNSVKSSAIVTEGAK